jgi:hypothetical protein
MLTGGARLERVEQQQDDERESQHAGGEPMGGVVLERFDVVVDGHRQHLCLARDVAADHQDHAELAHRMGKAEDARGHESRPGKRHDHGEEGIPGTGTQRRGSFQRLLADGLEGLLQRLHDEGHRVDHRGDDEASEGEGQGLQPARLPAAGRTIPSGPSSTSR